MIIFIALITIAVGLSIMGAPHTRPFHQVH